MEGHSLAKLEDPGCDVGEGVGVTAGRHGVGAAVASLSAASNAARTFDGPAQVPSTVTVDVQLYSFTSYYIDCITGVIFLPIPSVFFDFSGLFAPIYFAFFSNFPVKTILNHYPFLVENNLVCFHTDNIFFVS